MVHIDFVDLSALKDLEDWQLDKALTTVTEKIAEARQQLHDLNSWDALQEDLDEAQADLEELAHCKGHIRAEIARRHQYTSPFI